MLADSQHCLNALSNSDASTAELLANTRLTNYRTERQTPAYRRSRAHYSLLTDAQVTQRANACLQTVKRFEHTPDKLANACSQEPELLLLLLLLLLLS